MPAATPTFVLTKFVVSDALASEPLLLEGRRPGVVGWFLAVLKLGGRLRVAATVEHVEVRTTTLAGIRTLTIPLDQLESATCASSRPIALAIVTASAVLAAIAHFVIWVVMLGRGSVAVTAALLVLAVLAFVAYVLRQRVALAFGSSGGTKVSLAFKRGIVDGVSVNLATAERVIALLDTLVRNAGTRAPSDDAASNPAELLVASWAPPARAASAILPPRSSASTAPAAFETGAIRVPERPPSIAPRDVFVAPESIATPQTPADTMGAHLAAPEPVGGLPSQVARLGGAASEPSAGVVPGPDTNPAPPAVAAAPAPSITSPRTDPRSSATIRPPMPADSRFAQPTTQPVDTPGPRPEAVPASAEAVRIPSHSVDTSSPVGSRPPVQAIASPVRAVDEPSAAVRSHDRPRVPDGVHNPPAAEHTASRETPFRPAAPPPPMAPPIVRPAVAAGRRPAGRRGLVAAGVVVALLLAGSGAGWVAFVRPVHVVVENLLFAPVALAVADSAPRLLAPRLQTTLTVAPRTDVRLRWHAVADSSNWRPAFALADTVTVRPGSGTVRLMSRGRAGARFAPLITNTSRTTLHVAVNATLRRPDGVSAEEDCGCDVLPGATRQFVGYYPAFANSTVRVYDDAGRTAVFPDVGRRSDPRSGGVAITVSPQDLR